MAHLIIILILEMFKLLKKRIYWKLMMQFSIRIFLMMFMMINQLVVGHYKLLIKKLPSLEIMYGKDLQPIIKQNHKSTDQYMLEMD